MLVPSLARLEWTGSKHFQFLVLFLGTADRVLDWLYYPLNWLHVTSCVFTGLSPASEAPPVPGYCWLSALHHSVFLIMFSNYLPCLLRFLTTQIKAKGYNSAGAKTKGSFLQSERIFWIIFGAFYDFFVFYRLIFSLSVVLCVKVKLSLQKTNERKKSFAGRHFIEFVSKKENSEQLGLYSAIYRVLF